MGDSKEIMKILFLFLLSTWCRANPNWRDFTKLPKSVIDTFCVWLKMDKMAHYYVREI